MQQCRARTASVVSMAVVLVLRVAAHAGSFERSRMALVQSTRLNTYATTQQMPLTCNNKLLAAPTRLKVIHCQACIADFRVALGP